MSSTVIQQLRASSYIPTSCPPYHDTHGLVGLFERLAFEGPMFLVGPKGTGKSLAIRHYACELRLPLLTVDCSEDLRRSQLVGAYTLKGSETPFVLGPLAAAISLANSEGSAILNLEEVNALTRQSQKLLNPLTDFRQAVEIPEAGVVYRLEEGNKLWVVGSLNTADYGGVYELNEDLVSRVRLVKVPYPETAAELAMLREAIRPDLLAELPTLFLERLVRLAHETRQKGGVGYALSPRDLVMVAEDRVRLGEADALRILLGKYDGEGERTMQARLGSLFLGSPGAVPEPPSTGSPRLNELLLGRSDHR